jgi:hypothetical protein
VWRVLPPGIHDATLGEVVQRFGTTPHRQVLALGLVQAAQALRLAHCGTLYVNGSFTTDKTHPGDYDGCWEPAGVDYHTLDPVLRSFTLLGRAAQKAKYGGELFLSSMIADAIGTTYLKYFQKDKDTGLPKGIVRILL